MRRIGSLHAAVRLRRYKEKLIKSRQCMSCVLPHWLQHRGGSGFGARGLFQPWLLAPWNQFTLAWAVLVVISGVVIMPGVASAAPNPFGAPSSWSVPVSRTAEVVPQADGGVIANTSITTGGVASGGGNLVGITGGGDVQWKVPYVDQEYIDPFNLVTDHRGQHYWIDSRGSANRIIASSGSVELWSKPVNGGVGQHLAVGANGELYDFENDNTLHGYHASDGQDIFPAVKVGDLSGAVTNNLFVYNKGLIVISSEQISYFDLAGHQLSGPFSLTRELGQPILRSVSVSPNGDIFGSFFTSLPACNAPGTQTKVAKFTPTGLAWIATLSPGLTCTNSGIDVNVTPSGGIVVAGVSVSNGSRLVQHVTEDGQPDWLASVPTLPNTGDNVFFAPKVDEHGQIVLAQRFGFDCGLSSDNCVGVQIDRLVSYEM